MVGVPSGWPFTGYPISGVQPRVGEFTINWTLTSRSIKLIVLPVLIQIAPSVVA